MRHFFGYIFTQKKTRQKTVSEIYVCIREGGGQRQKERIYRVGAMKNHYLLTQIADIVMQIYLSWSPMIKGKSRSAKTEKVIHKRVDNRLTMPDRCG